jgi:hypothetical protein
MLGIAFSFYRLPWLMKKIANPEKGLPWYLALYRLYSHFISGLRAYIVMMHKMLGRVVVMYAVGVISSGLLQMGEETHGKLFWLYFGYTSLLVVLFVVLETNLQYKKYKHSPLWKKVSPLRRVSQ